MPACHNNNFSMAGDVGGVRAGAFRRRRGMTRIIAVTSGKGGVGKTHLSVNLALQCARRGVRTCLFDADLGLANVNLLLRLTPRHHLGDVIAGTHHLRDIVIRDAFAVDIVPGSSGVAEMADLGTGALRRLGEEFLALADYDLMILDTSAGVGSNVMGFLRPAPEILLVVTPEPTALTDAYALVKLLLRDGYAGRLRVLVNLAQSERQALQTYEKFREVVRVYQGVELELSGWVPADPQVTEAARQQIPVTVLDPDGPAGTAIQRLAERLLAEPPPAASDGIAAFWARMTGAAVAAPPPAVEPAAPAAAAPPESVPAPIPASIRVSRPPSAAPAHDRAFDDRLTRVEAALEAVMDELRALRGAPQAPSAVPPPSAVQPPVSRPAVSAPRDEDAPSPVGRRAGEMRSPAQGVRNALRPTPIDSLQLRRVVGRMLAKAGLATGDDARLPIVVEHVQIEADNDLSLRPGRYTRISLHCSGIASPDDLVEEVFAQCAITGCKVRQLGSQIRYWLTVGRDGCIVLDGHGRDDHCLSVYLAAGGNGLTPGEDTGHTPERVPSVRRVRAGDRPAESVSAALLGRYSHQRVATTGDMATYRILRRDREPLICAFAGAESQPGRNAARLERSPPN